MDSFLEMMEKIVDQWTDKIEAQPKQQLDVSKGGCPEDTPYPWVVA